VVYSLGLFVIGDVVIVEVADLGVYTVIVDLEYGVAAVEVDVPNGLHSLCDDALNLDRDFA
jgi:hypothetical protein